MTIYPGKTCRSRQIKKAKVTRKMVEKLGNCTETSGNNLKYGQKLNVEL